MGKCTAVLAGFMVISLAIPALSQSMAPVVCNLTDRIDAINKTKAPQACDKPKLKGNPTTFFKERLFCEILAKYPLAAPEPSFMGYEDNFCGPSWGPVKPWETPEGKKFTETFNNNFELPTRAQKIKSGFQVLSKDQREQYLKDAKAVREASMQTCCGENKDCQKHFKRIQVDFCDDTIAKNNPNKADSCARSPGVFSMDKGYPKDYETYVVNMAGLAVKSDLTVMNADERNYYIEKRNKAFADGGRKDLGEVSSGGIQLSPYSLNGIPVSSSQILSHELSHACSHIKRQMVILNLANPKESVKGATDSLRYAFKTRGPIPNCPLMENKTIEMFEKITDNLKGTDSKGLVKCLATLADKSVDPSSAVYVKDSCERGKMEEGFAEAMGFLSDPNISKDILMSRCWANISTFHPATADVLTCLLQNSPDFLAKAKKLMGCSAPETMP